MQRNKPITFYGWGNPGEKFNVQFAGKSIKTKVKADSSWEVNFSALPAGGPYKLLVNGKKTITLHDIWMGDVWFCSGQSNMEWKLGWLEKERKHLGLFTNHNIRVLTVPHYMGNKPESEIKKSSWKGFNTNNAADLSAVAAYFGHYLQPSVNVPIGLVVSAWGGTDIEAWMPEVSLTTFKNYKPSIQNLHSIINIDSFQMHAQEAGRNWEDSVNRLDVGLVSGWYKPSNQTTDWQVVQVPGAWDHWGIKGEGNGWFSRKFLIPSADAGKSALLSLGKTGNSAEVFINGEKIDNAISYDSRLIYTIPGELLQSEENIITVRITKLWGLGGFIGKEEDMFLQTPSGKKNLTGLWKFKPGYLSSNPALKTGPNNFPTSLYNGMVHPFTQLSFTGVLWYQGENNSNRPATYQRLLSALINNWRAEFKNDSLTFLIVQLPNYINSNPENRNYVLIRDAQQKAATLPGVGVAVTIDIGDSNDVHPVNKKDVGYRLSLLARKLAYHEDVMEQGPVLQNVQLDGNKVRLTFAKASNGLLTNDKYGYVRGFEVAGPDSIFHFAKAEIEGNGVIVYSKNIEKPIAIRYAWSEDPDASLFNAERLPAMPFYIYLK
ncbi:sialate O-acetylesterase [Lacibacter sp.]|uniref:sialate O-acetylesterase n=1 Tax=Lacibacter sp. TaxID=1915409 RepID=UPI002B4B71C0|nr:sialate O-acetylesterase [Lacibacter sp.]HLP38199.1 sialate O-acetylesterase [Lacibacter sp.]